MKCPECGNEIQEGHLICEVCGYEVQIVPDFEPEVEPQIDNHIVGDILDSDRVDGTHDDLGDTDSMSDDTGSLIPAYAISRRLITAAIVALAAILITVFTIRVVRRTGSPQQQLNNIKSMASQGKYEDAIRALENLYVSHPEESSIFFLEAEYYQELGKTDLAVDTLKRMLSSDMYDKDDIFSAYDRLINIYVSEGEYSQIAELLEECEYTEITQAYQNYVAVAPTFSYPEGMYDTAIRLKISANTSGTVYYTLDGSVPNTSGSQYNGPIELDHGEYVVSAIFINQYGIESEMTTGTYIISNEIPDAPVINADSGDYHTPMLITAEIPEGCTVYYTTDKSVPTEDSVRYIDPIPMPVDYSNFNFVAISDDGLTSEVVVRSYSLTFIDGISYNEAIDILKTRLIERGLIRDMNGYSDRMPGRYTYEVISAITIDGQGDYYCIAEFYHDGSGAKTYTETRYIVELHNGSPAILGGDAISGFVAVAF